MSSSATTGPWLSSYESDASDEDEVLSPEVSAEDMVDEGGEVLVHSYLLMTLTSSILLVLLTSSALLY
jgi:hypothetical protein